MSKRSPILFSPKQKGYTMNIIDKAKNTFDTEIEKIARSNIIEKLYKQDIDYKTLSEEELESLIEAEKEILESDTKKVGLGIAIGVGISLLTGI